MALAYTTYRNGKVVDSATIVVTEGPAAATMYPHGLGGMKAPLCAFIQLKASSTGVAAEVVSIDEDNVEISADGVWDGYVLVMEQGHAQEILQGP